MPCSASGSISLGPGSWTVLTRLSAKCFGSIQQRDALLQLQKLYQDQNQWSDATGATRAPREDEPEHVTRRHLQIQAFLENELGMQGCRSGLS